LASCGTGHHCSLSTGGERERAGIKTGLLVVADRGRERARLCAADTLFLTSALCK